MKRNVMIKISSMVLLLAYVMVSSVFVGCSSDDDPAPAPIPTKTVWELIQDDPNLDSAEKYLDLNPTLVAALSDTVNDVSFFAPDNAAFVNLLQTPGFPDKFSLITPAIITGVLAYHIIPGEKVTKNGLAAGDMLTSLQGEDIEVNPGVGNPTGATGTLFTGSTNEEILIKGSTKKGTNGNVNVVESVMIPPTVGASLTPILGTIAGDVLLGADFTTLAGIVAKADQAAPSAAQSITAILADSLITAFLVPNDVFTVAGLDSSSFPAAIARGFMLSHLIDGPDLYITDSLTNGRVLVSKSGLPITVAVSGTTITVVGLTPPAAPIVVPDEGRVNGVYHVIAGILQ
jgi:uncharacterized surface protein with fasciclin (FAS1) repeats